MAGKPCWEYLECGREKGGKKEKDFGVCPAFYEGGNECWTVAGTYCEGKIQGTYAEKILDCKNCDYFRAYMNDEV